MDAVPTKEDMIIRSETVRGSAVHSARTIARPKIPLPIPSTGSIFRNQNCQPQAEEKSGSQFSMHGSNDSAHLSHSDPQFIRSCLNIKDWPAPD